MQIQLPNGNIADVAPGTANEMVRNGYATMIEPEPREVLDESTVPELEPDAEPEPQPDTEPKAKKK